MCPTVTFDASDRSFVHAVVRRVLRRDPAVEDVTQEALLLAFRFRDGFRGDCAYRTWLYRIAWTAAMGFVRRRRARDVPLRTDMVDDRPTADAELIALEDRIDCARMLAQLPASHRDVLLVRLDHSDEETAARLGLSVSNVKVRAHRARTRLRALCSTPPGQAAVTARH